MKVKLHHMIGTVTLAISSIAYAQQPYTTDTNTLFLYHFDETSGTTAYDSSGNGLDATYGSSMNIGLPSVTGLSNTIKTTNNLNGRTTYLDTTSPGTNSFLYNLSAGDFTIETWVRLDENFSSGNRFLAAIQPEGVALWDLSFTILASSGNYYLALGDKNGPNRVWTVGKPITLTLGTWYHLAVTGTALTNGTNWSYKFYYTEAGGGTTTPTALYTNINTYLAPRDANSTNNRILGMGNYYGDNGLAYFPGLIDEVRISDIARTEFMTLIPEPTTLFLLGTGAALLFLRRRRD